MSEDPILAAPVFPVAPPPGEVDAPEPSVVVAERQLAMLREIAETGMEMIRILKQRTEIDLQTAKTLTARADLADNAVYGPGYPAPMQDPSAMFARLSRAVRLTLALEAKTDERLRALVAGVAVEREKHREETARRVAEAAEARQKAAKEKVYDRVLKVILAQDLEDPDGTESWGLAEALDERLDEDDAYMDLADRPLREVVERLCADLCIEPDWSRWTGDDWAARPFPSRPKWSEFNTPSRKKLLPDRPSPPAWGFPPQARGP
jgi:hypothetical protein